MDKKLMKEILKHCNNTELQQFIIDYAAKNTAFEKAFMARFNPEKVSTGSKEDYVSDIESAFHNNMQKGGNRYSGWDDFGLDAYAVAIALKPLLEKVDYYLQNNNVSEAILICRGLIETIPDEWNDEGDDEDGDVQVVYDTAIDKLQELLEENRLSKTQKEALFEWYSEENKLRTKHEYVGLNTSLGVLESYFIDSPEMLHKNLANIDDRINNATSDYNKEDAAMSKIHLLQKAELDDEAESAITQYIRFQNVRKLHLEKLIKEKRYAGAIELIQVGIKIATQEKHPGTVINWKEDLLAIYKLQKNFDEILSVAEELFYSNQNSDRKYYEELKKYTPEKDWAATLERLLSKMDCGFFGFNDLKADMLIEHKMWDRLFALCEKAGTEKLEEYEKYLKPLYAKEIFEAYQKYVEEQALITVRGGR